MNLQLGIFGIEKMFKLDRGAYFCSSREVDLIMFLKIHFAKTKFSDLDQKDAQVEFFCSCRVEDLPFILKINFKSNFR